MKKPVMLPDTNIILRYLLHDVEEQFIEANAFFEQVRTGKTACRISDAVLVECQYILAKYYGVSRGDIAVSLTGLLQYRGIVNHDRNILLRSLALYAETGFDPVDCLLAANHESNAERVMTFDKKLKKLCIEIESKE